MFDHAIGFLKILKAYLGISGPRNIGLRIECTRVLDLYFRLLMRPFRTMSLSLNSSRDGKFPSFRRLFICQGIIKAFYVSVSLIGFRLSDRARHPQKSDPKIRCKNSIVVCWIDFVAHFVSIPMRMLPQKKEVGRLRE